MAYLNNASVSCTTKSRMPVEFAQVVTTFSSKVELYYLLFYNLESLIPYSELMCWRLFD